MAETNYLRDGRAPIPENVSTSKVMSANRGKNTKPEMILRKALWNSGLRGYRLHWKKAPGKPDISYPGRRIAIFVNGCFWHRCPNCNPSMPKTNVEFWQNKFQKNKNRDKRKLEELEKSSWSVFVFWECEIRNDVNSCIKSIRNHINR